MEDAIPETLFEFPCDFPIKVMGRNQDDFCRFVFDLVLRHAPGLQEEALDSRLSGSGNYLSITVNLWAQSKAQVDAIYQELSSEPRVLMAL